MSSSETNNMNEDPPPSTRQSTSESTGTETQAEPSLGEASGNAVATNATAMNRTPFNFPVPAPMSCKGDQVNNWEFFKQQWMDYEVATGLNLNPVEIRLATFRSVMGKECLQIFLNLNLSEEDKRDIGKCIDELENYFKPKRNIVYERYVFNSCTQGAEESVDSFVIRLRKLADSCEFRQLTDEMMRDRLVVGLRDTHTKTKLLRVKDLDLNKAIEICRADELAQKHVRSMTDSLEERVQMMKERPAKKRTGRDSSNKPKKTEKSLQRTATRKKSVDPCKFCAKNVKHDKKEECPAFGAKCRNCGKNNHFAVACRSTKAVHSVLDDATDSDDETVLQIEELSTVLSSGKQLLTHVNFLDGEYTVKLVCQLDTGASCNVISHRDLAVITQNGEPPMKASKVKLKLFDGSVMPTLGQCTLKAKIHENKVHTLHFQVVESNNKPLLSAETCKLLDLVKVEEINTMSSPHYTPMSKEEILKEYKDVFEGLGHIGSTSFKLDPTVPPVQHNPRRVPVALKEEVKKKIVELERKQILKKETEHTEWISSMVVVSKPGKLRICLDPKDLNKAVQRPKYPMSTMEEVLPSLSKAKVFSTLDAKDGFYQVSLDEESSKATTFWTPFGRYRYLRLPFGINLAPEVFERILQEKLSGLDGVEVLRDDILVTGCGETDAEANQNHDENMRRLLQRAHEVGLKLNSQKISLRKSEVKFMGHVLTKDGLKADPDKVKAVKEMPKPTCKKEVLHLLGFVNYLSKFLPKLSEVAQPLRELTMKNASFTWSTQHDKAFSEVKQLVVKHPVLRYYDINEEVTVQTDASDRGLGATLLQNGQPVAFASRSLSEIETRYAQIEKECLAVVFGCERFSQYISRREKVTVETDHKPLQSIFKKSILAAPCRLQRMLLRLQRFNLEVIYKPGSQMYVADHLSRAFLKDEESLIDDFQVFALEIEKLNPFDTLKVTKERLAQLQKATEQDKDLQTLKTTVVVGWPELKEYVPVNIQEYWNYRDEISVHNGILFKNQRVIIPAAMRREILARVHASHLGIEACIRKAKDVVFWPGMSAQIKELIQNCNICAEYQAKNPRQPMQTHDIPDRPWSRVNTDLFKFLDKDYIVLVDSYSDFPEVGELEDTTTEPVVQFLKEQFSRHGIPDKLVSDNGSQFVSQEFSQFAREWEFEHSTSSPHHPRGNGKAESAVKVVKNLFKKAIRAGKDPWLALLDYRNTPTEGIYASPAQRLMSRRTRTRLPTATNLLRPKVVEDVKEKIKVKRRKAKKYYDQSTKVLPKLEVGQEVKVDPLQRNKPWKSARVVESLTDRSCVVENDLGNMVRRNREAVRPVRSDDTSVEEVAPQAPAVVEMPEVNGPATPEKTAEVRTRTRVIRRPVWMKDFVDH